MSIGESHPWEDTSNASGSVRGDELLLSSAFFAPSFAGGGLTRLVWSGTHREIGVGADMRGLPAKLIGGEYSPFLNSSNCNLSAKYYLRARILFTTDERVPG